MAGAYDCVDGPVSLVRYSEGTDYESGVDAAGD